MSLQPFQAFQLCKEPVGFIDIFTILQQLFLFHDDDFYFFNIIGNSRPNSVYLPLEGFVFFCLVLRVNLLF
jgi:hypothetical protein